MTKPKKPDFSPVGPNTHRFEDNPEEEAFARAWAKENQESNPYGLLACLLDPDHTCKGRPPRPSDRDIFVAATVIQWLGSPVGRGFLRDLGYEKKETEE